MVRKLFLNVGSPARFAEGCEPSYQQALGIEGRLRDLLILGVVWEQTP